MSRILAALAVVLATTVPALAQFPPPGVYRCTTADTAPAGVLTLLAAGDYQYQAVSDADFTVIADDPANGSGQVASAGADIDPQSGPLKDHFAARGSFATDKGVTRFTFTDADGQVVLLCGP